MNTPQPAHPRWDALRPAAGAEEVWELVLRFAVRAPSARRTGPIRTIMGAAVHVFTGWALISIAYLLRRPRLREAGLAAD